MTQLTEPRTKGWRFFASNMCEPLSNAKPQGQAKALMVACPLRKSSSSHTEEAVMTQAAGCTVAAGYNSSSWSGVI